MSDRAAQKHGSVPERKASKFRPRRKEHRCFYNHADAQDGQEQADWQRYRSVSAYLYSKELENIRAEMVAMYIGACKHEVRIIDSHCSNKYVRVLAAAFSGQAARRTVATDMSTAYHNASMCLEYLLHMYQNIICIGLGWRNVQIARLRPVRSASRLLGIERVCFLFVLRRGLLLQSVSAQTSDM